MDLKLQTYGQPVRTKSTPSVPDSVRILAEAADKHGMIMQTPVMMVKYAKLFPKTDKDELAAILAASLVYVPSIRPITGFRMPTVVIK